MEERYLLSDFWIHSADGSVRSHYQHFNDELTMPDAYVLTTFITNNDGTKTVVSSLISKTAYTKALDYALNH